MRTRFGGRVERVLSSRDGWAKCIVRYDDVDLRRTMSVHVSDLRTENDEDVKQLDKIAVS